MNKLLLLGCASLGLCAFANGDVLKRVLTIPAEFDGVRRPLSLPRFDPKLGTLRRVRVYSFLHWSGSVTVENIDPRPLSGAVQFSAQVTIWSKGDLSRVWYGAAAFADSKMMKVRLAGFDGVADGNGADAWRFDFANSAGQDYGYTSNAGILNAFAGSAPLEAEYAAGAPFMWMPLKYNYLPAAVRNELTAVATFVFLFEYTRSGPN